MKVLRYIKGSLDFSLDYHKSEILNLFGFTDADWANSPCRRSQTGYIYYLNDNSSPISWSSRKQRLVATSTTNAEYVALSEATNEALWLQKLFYGIEINNINYHPTQLLCDNTGALALAHTPANHKRSKHIDIKFMHIRSHVDEGDIQLDHIRSHLNIADGFTKSLGPTLFNKFKDNLSKSSKQSVQINVISRSLPQQQFNFDFYE